MPKGVYIRMVYNSTSIMLKSALWDPQFALLNVQFTTRAVDRGTYMVYWYIGKNVLKFILSEELRLYYGVDLNQVWKD